MMDGFFQEGDKLKSIMGQEKSDYVFEAVGRNEVTKILVSKADGPMGYYPIAVVYRGDRIAKTVALHMMEVVDLL